MKTQISKLFILSGVALSTLITSGWTQTTLGFEKPTIGGEISSYRYPFADRAAGPNRAALFKEPLNDSSSVQSTSVTNLGSILTPVVSTPEPITDLPDSIPLTVTTPEPRNILGFITLGGLMLGNALRKVRK